MSTSANLTAALMALAFATPASAIEPVDMGDAHDYSVVASAVTSTGATAMSDNLGSTAPVAGTPIVLGQTHVGAAADAAKASMNLAYGDAQLRPSTGGLPANLAGASLGPGVHTATGALGFTASGVLTLTGDEDAVFILQIGAALTIGASAQVQLQGGALPCNVFWQVNGAATIGAGARLAGTLMADADITVGAGGRVDGRVLSKGAVTLDANAIRTACTATELVAGPAGPAGADGTDGTDGTDGIQGETGARGPAGLDGASGTDGVNGLNGLNGLQGPAGTAGADGAVGPAGIVGSDGAAGANGAAGIAGMDGADGTDGVDGAQGIPGKQGANGAVGPSPIAETAELCVTKRASRREVRRGGLVVWIIAVRNCGERSASGVAVTDRLRTGATVKSRGGASLAGGRLRWKIGALAPGARKTYRVATRFKRNARLGRYFNRARADGDNTRPATGRGSVVIAPA